MVTKTTGQKHACLNPSLNGIGWQIKTKKRLKRRYRWDPMPPEHILYT